VLDAALDGGTAYVREAAVGLAYRAGLPSLAMLMRALGDADAAVRRQAAGALGFLGPDAGEAVSALIDMLGDKDARARESAADALRAITGQALGADKAAWRDWTARGKPTAAPMTEWDGIPLPPGSRWAGATGTMHALTVDAPCDQARAFYAAQMPVLGWKDTSPTHVAGVSFRKGAVDIDFAYRDATAGRLPGCHVQFWLGGP
jgi:hypothetical protein